MPTKRTNGSKALAVVSREMTHQLIPPTSCTFLSKVSSTANGDRNADAATGGLTNRYGVAHEQWMWDLKSEPAIVDVFSDIWGTNELLASFGGSATPQSTFHVC